MNTALRDEPAITDGSAVSADESLVSAVDVTCNCSLTWSLEDCSRVGGKVTGLVTVSCFPSGGNMTWDNGTWLLSTGVRLAMIAVGVDDGAGETVEGPIAAPTGERGIDLPAVPTGRNTTAPLWMKYIDLSLVLSSSRKFLSTST